MKALGKCSRCKKELETDCEGCILAGTSFHKCKKGLDVVDVKWKVFAENEDEFDKLEGLRV